MIRRRSASKTPSLVNSAVEEHITAVNGIHVDTPMTDMNSVHDIVNFELDKDGALILRRPLIGDDITEDKKYMYLLYDKVHTLYIDALSNVSVGELNIKLRYTDVNNVVHTLEYPESDSISDVIINLQNIIRVHTQDSTILIGAKVWLNSPIFDPEIIDDSLYSSTAILKARMLRCYIEDDDFIIEIINPEVNTFTGNDTATEFNPNLYLDNPTAIRDLYEYGGVGITQLLAYRNNTSPETITYTQEDYKSLVLPNNVVGNAILDIDTDAYGTEFTIWTKCNMSVLDPNKIDANAVTHASQVFVNYISLIISVKHSTSTNEISKTFNISIPIWTPAFTRVHEFSKELFNNILLENGIDTDDGYIEYVTITAKIHTGTDSIYLFDKNCQYKDQKSYASLQVSPINSLTIPLCKFNYGDDDDPAISLTSSSPNAVYHSFGLELELDKQSLVFTRYNNTNYSAINTYVSIDGVNGKKRLDYLYRYVLPLNRVNFSLYRFTSSETSSLEDTTVAKLTETVDNPTYEIVSKLNTTDKHRIVYKAFNTFKEDLTHYYATWEYSKDDGVTWETAPEFLAQWNNSIISLPITDASKSQETLDAADTYLKYIHVVSLSATSNHDLAYDRPDVLEVRSENVKYRYRYSIYFYDKNDLQPSNVSGFYEIMSNESSPFRHVNNVYLGSTFLNGSNKLYFCLRTSIMNVKPFYKINDAILENEDLTTNIIVINDSPEFTSGRYYYYAIDIESLLDETSKGVPHAIQITFGAISNQGTVQYDTIRTLIYNYMSFTNMTVVPIVLNVNSVLANIAHTTNIGYESADDPYFDSNPHVYRDVTHTNIDDKLDPILSHSSSNVITKTADDGSEVQFKRQDVTLKAYFTVINASSLSSPQHDFEIKVNKRLNLDTTKGIIFNEYSYDSSSNRLTVTFYYGGATGSGTALTQLLQYGGGNAICEIYETTNSISPDNFIHKLQPNTNTALINITSEKCTVATSIAEKAKDFIDILDAGNYSIRDLYPLHDTFGGDGEDIRSYDEIDTETKKTKTEVNGPFLLRSLLDRKCAYYIMARQVADNNFNNKYGSHISTNFMGIYSTSFPYYICHATYPYVYSSTYGMMCDYDGNPSDGSQSTVSVDDRGFALEFTYKVFGKDLNALLQRMYISKDLYDSLVSVAITFYDATMPREEHLGLDKIPNTTVICGKSDAQKERNRIGKEGSGSNIKYFIQFCQPMSRANNHDMFAEVSLETNLDETIEEYDIKNLDLAKLTKEQVSKYTVAPNTVLKLNYTLEGYVLNNYLSDLNIIAGSLGNIRTFEIGTDIGFTFAPETDIHITGRFKDNVIDYYVKYSLSNKKITIEANKDIKNVQIPKNNTILDNPLSYTYSLSITTRDTAIPLLNIVKYLIYPLVIFSSNQAMTVVGKNIGTCIDPDYTGWSATSVTNEDVVFSKENYSNVNPKTNTTFAWESANRYNERVVDGAVTSNKNLTKATLISQKEMVLQYTNDETEVLKPSKAALSEAKVLMYHNRFLFYNIPNDFNVYISDTDSFITPLYNTIDLAYGFKPTKILPWRNYLIVFTTHCIYLVSENPDGTFASKLLNTNIGLSEADAETPAVILNSIIFKSGAKVYKLVPNLYAATDTVLNLTCISDGIEPYLCNGGKCFAFATDDKYFLFYHDPFTIENPVTKGFQYHLTEKTWTRQEYPCHIVDYEMLNFDDIRLYVDADPETTHVMQRMLFNDTLDTLEDDVVAELPWGDWLHNTIEEVSTYNSENPLVTDDDCTHFDFEVDIGQKSSNYMLDKQFLETKFIFSSKSERDMFPLNIYTYTDGSCREFVYLDPNTSAALQKTIFNGTDTSHLGTVNTTFLNTDDTATGILRQLFIKYSGKGKTIRHKFLGTSANRFKFYSLDYRYRTLPKKQ